MNVSQEQALAFVDALTGWDGVSPGGADCGQHNSPGARLHLAAALGQGNVVTYQAAYRVVNRTRPTAPDYQNLLQFCDYLEAVTKTLRAGIHSPLFEETAKGASE